MLERDMIDKAINRTFSRGNRISILAAFPLLRCCLISLEVSPNHTFVDKSAHVELQALSFCWTNQKVQSMCAFDRHLTLFVAHPSSSAARWSRTTERTAKHKKKKMLYERRECFIASAAALAFRRPTDQRTQTLVLWRKREQKVREKK